MSIFKKTPLRLGHLWRFLLMHIPDLRQQGWQLLVLEPQCKDLLRMYRAEGAQAHQLHEHSWEAELVLPGRGGKQILLGALPCKASIVWKASTQSGQANLKPNPAFGTSLLTSLTGSEKAGLRLSVPQHVPLDPNTETAQLENKQLPYLGPLDPRVGEESLHVGLLQCLHTAGLLHVRPVG